MSPQTRSSTSFPAKSGQVSPTTPAARRAPHCTKCHRPRAGHPRTGCPFVDTSAADSDDHILDELSSLRIVSPTHECAPPIPSKSRRFSVRFALVPEQTLASLSPTDSHLVEQLLQPGILSDDVTPQDRVAHVLKWRKTLHESDTTDGAKEAPVQAKTESESPPLSRRMPCTLTTPTASLTATDRVTDQGIGGSTLDMNETIYLLPDSGVANTPRPLGRSMSFEQRSLFLQQLSQSSSTAPATLVSLPLADLDSVQADAEKVGFIVRVLPGREDNHKWVILGTQEEAVDILAAKFLEEEKRGTKANGKGGKLTAAAGGVIFGAVATWTGLAFS